MTDLSQLTGDKRRALIAALDNGGAVFGETDILEALGLCETHDGERIPLTALRITPAGRLLAQALRVIHAKEIQNEKARRESAENPDKVFWADCDKCNGGNLSCIKCAGSGRTSYMNGRLV